MTRHTDKNVEGIALSLIKPVLKHYSTKSSLLPVTVAVRSEVWVLAGWLLGSWVQIPLKAWLFVPCLSVLCCPV
jgi:hypothetical protein